MAVLNVSCACPMKGHPDTQSCYELFWYQRTPVVRPGEVLDAAIVVGAPEDEVAIGDPDFVQVECECACHWGAD